MITRLTQAQQSRLAEFRDKWIAIGLSTAPANREKAEAAIRQSYRLAGLKEPRQIVWCGSPLSQGLTRSIVLGDSVRASVDASVGASVRASVRDSVGDSVWDSVGASVWASVRDSVGDSVWDSVRASVRDSVGASVWDSVGASVWDSVRDSVGDSVGDSVRASVRDSVGDSVWDSVRDSVGDSVWDSVRASVRDSVGASVRDSVGASVWDSVRDSVGASVRDSVGDSGYGQHDAHWLGFYDYFRRVCRLTAQTDKLAGLIDYAQYAGWFLAHSDICWVSERHHILRRNGRGQLHAVTGPAVQYPDGWSIYALNGVRVPEWLVETPADDVDVQRVMKEPNVEVRREAIRLIGIDRVVAKLEAKTLHAERGYELISVDMNHGDPWRFLKMQNPSINAIHIEAVPRECETVQHAINYRTYRQIDPATDWQPSQLT